MGEILQLIPDLNDWPAALVAIALIAGLTILGLARSAHHIAAFLKYWDERSYKRAIRKAQRKCPHRWVFRPFRPLGWEEYTTCAICRLKLPTEQVILFYPDQFQAALEYSERNTQKNDDLAFPSVAQSGVGLYEFPGFDPGKYKQNG